MSLSFPLNGPDAPTRFPDQSPAPEDALRERLRQRVLTGLHMGRLAPGDRLPSIRSLARETGLDHRAVAEVYYGLEEEGLVEVRGRSGVRVAEPPERAREELRDWARWMAEVMASGWERGMSSGDLSRLTELCWGAREIRCACVESNQDQMEAYCAELAELTGMTLSRVSIAPGDQTRIAGAARRSEVRAALSDVDLVVTTQYHVAAVRSVLPESIPLVTLRIHSELAAAVRAQIRRRGRLTVVAVTEEFGRRLRLMYGDVLEREEQLRLVLADDEAGLRALEPSEPILLTRAARQRIQRPGNRVLVFPHSPTLAPDTIQELSVAIVRRNLLRNDGGAAAAVPERSRAQAPVRNWSGERDLAGPAPPQG